MDHNPVAASLGERHPGTTGLLRFFAWEHLPPALQAISAPCAHLAQDMANRLPDGPELTAGLRKLLEAKDCFVRAALPPPPAYPLISRDLVEDQGPSILDQIAMDRRPLVDEAP